MKGTLYDVQYTAEDVFILLEESDELKKTKGMRRTHSARPTTATRGHAATSPATAAVSSAASLIGGRDYLLTCRLRLNKRVQVRSIIPS
jgi:hypothetical protein